MWVCNLFMMARATGDKDFFLRNEKKGEYRPGIFPFFLSFFSFFIATLSGFVWDAWIMQQRCFNTSYDIDLRLIGIEFSLLTFLLLILLPRSFHFFSRNFLLERSFCPYRVLYYVSCSMYQFDKLTEPHNSIDTNCCWRGILVIWLEKIDFFLIFFQGNHFGMQFWHADLFVFKEYLRFFFLRN